MSETLQSGRYLLKRCARCGEAFEVKRRYAFCTKYCPECRRIVERESRRKWRLGQLAAIRDEARAKAKERARFFAARDRAFERAGLPKPVVVKAGDGSLVERRGRCGGGSRLGCFGDAENEMLRRS